MKIEKLIETIKKLRHPLRGCDWDKKQTHKTLMKYVIEEAYEVVDAIDEVSEANLKEELGDLLLQIVLHSEIASENKNFNFDDVVVEINNKMIRRHPHVFKNKKILNDEELKNQWELIKKKEKDKNYNNTYFPKINKTQSALLQALEISKVAKKYNFDWENYDGPLNKMQEEILEIQNELKKRNKKLQNIELEIGDLLFSIVNLCKHLEINPEIAMIKANNKFIKRFKSMINQFKNKQDFIKSSMKKKNQSWKKIKKL